MVAPVVHSRFWGAYIAIYSPARVELRVDLVDYPTEQPPVECLGHGVSYVYGLLHSVGSHDGLPMGYHVGTGEGLGQVLLLQTQEMSNCAMERKMYLVASWSRSI